MRRVLDVVVVGAGHAGCEAATAAARGGARTLLLTHNTNSIGEMSCNPSFGGIGKGQLMREVDALDGVCARVADQAAITYQALNRSHGPAVIGLRAQIDRKLYKKHMQQEILERTPNLSVEEASVEDLRVAGEAVTGLVLDDGRVIETKTVVIATGTFLGGEIFHGLKRIPAGRIGEKSATGLSRSMARLGLRLGRLRTGTPPRLLLSSIDLSRFTRMPPDQDPIFFSFLTQQPGIAKEQQLPTYLGETNEGVRRLVEANLHVNEHIRADTNGPRYCPSLESKIIRFPHLRHRLFLEHEGLDSDVMYPQGLSMTFEEQTQLAILRCIPGLEKVEIVQPGYGVQYDFVDPRQLDSTLQVKNLKGLFLAGQINGTTGYEEAAAQGVVAGANAASSALGSSPLLLGRADSYLGVLIDDLTTLGTNEPYRMFSSRVEFRLHLRPDNADLRLTEVGRRAGIVGDSRWELFSQLQSDLLSLQSSLSSTLHSSSVWMRLLPGLRISSHSQILSAVDLMHRHGIRLSQLAPLIPSIRPFSHRTELEERIRVDGSYAKMHQRMKDKMEEVSRDAATRLPEDLDFSSIKGLSEECMEKLERARPLSLAAASRIQGVTPEAILSLLHHLRRIPSSSAMV